MTLLLALVSKIRFRNVNPVNGKGTCSKERVALLRELTMRWNVVCIKSLILAEVLCFKHLIIQIITKPNVLPGGALESCTHKGTKSVALW